MNENAESLAHARADALWAADAASQHLGMVLRHVAPGRAEIAMIVQPFMVNGVGTCHGGYLFTLADSAFAFACNTGHETAVASHAEITFIRPVRAGEHLVAVAVLRAGFGRSGLYDVSVQDADGEPVAEFRGHARLIGTRPAGQGNAPP